MHVGVEKIVTENLREKDLHAVFRQHADVRVARPQLRHVADEHAVDAFHDQDFRAAVIPVNLRHIQQVGAREIAAQLGSVGRFAHEVEFVDDGLFVFVHHLGGPQPIAFLRIIARQPRDHVHDLQVTLDLLAHAGAHDLDDDFLAGAQPGRMHLRDGGGRERLFIEALEDLRRPAGHTPVSTIALASAPGKAARDPAAWRVHRRCRSAAGRAGWTAPGRTS